MFSLNIYKGNYMRLLIIPAVLFVLFIFLAFIYPTPPRGIELKGGSLIILKTDSALDAKEVENYLLSISDIQELKVFSVSAANTNGLTIEYTGVRFLEDAKKSLESAKELLKTNPLAAKQEMDKTISFLGTYFKQKKKYDSFISSKDYAKAFSLIEQSFYDAEKTYSDFLVNKISEKFKVKVLAFQKEDIAPTLGESFWQTAISLSITAAILVIIVVFLFFRDLVPSLAILLAASFDIVCALAFMAILQIPLSLSSIPALLMLIGYSVDTDIMLTSRLLSSKHALRKEVLSSMRTGLTMTFTTIFALLAMAIISYFTQINVIFNLSIVLLFGLFGDVISTWLMNAPILMKYLESKGGQL